MRKWVTLICLGLTVFALGGCGSKKEDGQAAGTERFNLKDIQAEDYVDLGEYKGLSVAVSKAPVDEEQVKTLTLREYCGQVSAENGGVTNRAVEQGDTVVLDYEGKRDGVAFEGGTAQGATLEIGSGAFIDGFEDGLVGVMPGETVDLNLTFPDPYPSNPDLAGVEVVFTVTVQYIWPDEMWDEVVAGFGSQDYATVEELQEYVRASLEELALEQYNTDVESAIADAVVNNASFGELPQEMLDQYAANVKQSVNNAALSNYGVDGETFTQVLYQMTLDEFASTNALMSAKQVIAYQAIANLEGIAITDEQIEEQIKPYADQYGMTVEEVLQQADREEFREMFMLDAVTRFLRENTTITEE